MSLLPGRRARWAALAATVGALAIGGIAWADIPDSGVVHGCYKTVTGVLRVIDTSAGDSCTPGETPLSWNQAGPTGVTGSSGPTGATGPTGTAGPSIFERALGGGDVPNDPGTIGSLPLPPGKYLITAKLDVAPSAVGTNTDDWWQVQCTLVAGNDTDFAAEADDTSDFHFSREGTMSMMVTHEFSNGGSADVICDDRGDQSGPSDADFFSLVIAAIQAGDLQHP
jgi:hypothetical protein